ncbi:hypothetical protein ACFQYP_63605 [Nonomuraea antimicrobica]
MWPDPATGGAEGYAVAAEHVGDDWIVESVSKTASDAATISVTPPADVPANSLPQSAQPSRSDWWRS